MSNKLRGKGLKMDITPQYLASGFVNGEASPERRAQSQLNTTEKQKILQQIADQAKFNEIKEQMTKKQMNMITVQHMDDIAPNRKTKRESNLQNKSALAQDYPTKELTPLILNRRTESKPKKKISRDQSGALIRTQREMTHRPPQQSNNMILNDSQNNIMAASMDKNGAVDIGNENIQTSLSDIMNTNKKQTVSPLVSKRVSSNNKVLFQNLKNIQKVIGIDMSMGNYASTQNDIQNTNSEVIRKYFEGKGHNTNTFSTGRNTGLETHQTSVEKSGDEDNMARVDTMINTQRLDTEDPMNIVESQSQVAMVSQIYGHGKSHNKRQIIGVMPQMKLNRFPTLDPTIPRTTEQKFNTLERFKEQTNALAAERVENRLAKYVTENQKDEYFERQQIRDSIMNEFNIAIQHKQSALNNNEVLKRQIKNQIDNLKQELKAGIEHDKLMNEPFERDNTLRCAFPRIHAPTDDMVKEQKKIKQKELCEQYDSMMKEKIQLKNQDQANDKEMVNREAEKAEKAMMERDRKEKENMQRVNRVCVEEWEMRLRAKDFLRKVRKNTVKQLNKIVQDGTMFKNQNPMREMSWDQRSNNKLRGKGIYNPKCLLNLQTEDPRVTEAKKVPVHIRLFGQKDSPSKQQESNENAYKSNNRDWQKGLRQSTNPKQSNQDGPTFNILNHSEQARKKQFELTSEPLFDDYKQSATNNNGRQTAGANQTRQLVGQHSYDIRSHSKASNVQRMLAQKKFSQKLRSQSVERNSYHGANKRNVESRGSDYQRMPNTHNNTRSQQIKKVQENGKQEENPAPSTFTSNPEGKERRLNRAKDYLDQVINAHQSRSKGRPADNKSFMTHQDLVEMQDKLDSKSQVRAANRDQNLLEGDNDNYLSSTARKAHGFSSLTRENLRRLPDRDELSQTPNEELMTYGSDVTIDFKQLLVSLHLPENLFQKMEEMPEELWAYILDEIIYEAQLQKFSTVQRDMIDNQKSQQQKMISVIQKKRNQVALENLETIKNNHIQNFQEKKRTIERDKRMNELYPKNMKDETKSATWERKEEKQKQMDQFEMLKQQQENVFYPKHEDVHILQKQLEDRYFTELAQKEKQAEIEEILQKREERFSKAMSIKKDWDMNINLNKLIKEVETNPRNFYDSLDGPDKKKLKTVDIFENKTSRHGNHVTEQLKSIDREHLKMERQLSKKQPVNVEKYENLLSKVSRDIDKKSSYSRKLESQFQKIQIKQADKNRKLLQADSKEQLQTKQEIEDALLGRIKHINPLMNINKERKKLNNQDALEKDSQAKEKNITDQETNDKTQDQSDFMMATGQSIKKMENVNTKKIKPMKNVFLRLSEIAKKKDQGTGSSPQNVKTNEYGCTLQTWLDTRKGVKKTASQQVSRSSSKPKIVDKQRPSTRLDTIHSFTAEADQKKPGNRRTEAVTLQPSPREAETIRKDGSRDELRDPLQSLLVSRQTGFTEQNPIEGWVAKPAKDTDLRKMRNTSQVIQRKVQRTDMDRGKLARIPDEIFYNDDAMMRVHVPGTFDVKNMDSFKHYKSKLAGADKKRPKLADLFEQESSLDSPRTKSRIERHQRGENAKTAMEGERGRPFKYTPITNPDTSFSRTAAPSDNKNLQSHLFPWENRHESIKQLNKMMKF